MAAGEPDLARRVAALEDRAAIAALVSNYCHGVDKRDERRFLSIWHADAAWRIGEPFGDFKGIDEIRHALVDLIWPALPETHHFTTNLVVELDDDRATGLSDVDCTGTDVEGRAIIISATYSDVYERREGRWALADRRVEIHYFTPLREPWGSDPATRMRPPRG